MEEASELSVIAGKNLAILRNKLHMTQDKCAEILGISNYHLSNFENGKYGVSLKVIEKILKYFKLTPDELFNDNAKKNEKDELFGIIKDNMETFGFNLYMELSDFYSSKDENPKNDRSDYKIPSKSRLKTDKVADSKKRK